MPSCNMINMLKSECDIATGISGIFPVPPETNKFQGTDIYSQSRVFMAQLGGGQFNPIIGLIKPALAFAQKIPLLLITTTLRRERTDIRLPETERHIRLTVDVPSDEVENMRQFTLEIIAPAEGITITGETPKRALKRVVKRANGLLYAVYTATWRNESRQSYRIETDGRQMSLSLTPKIVPAR